ncbi:hypothetical protein J1605_005364 [Eschrichtius robustus]|uniref:Uncharacterized protein n=1 Tax=Eschrichtius robustus TaxID=9764 RepID=A0AB34H9J9_ESCRO|nr:hypothetical protein J1605_005364 [Eschrichtius robustus]
MKFGGGLLIFIHSSPVVVFSACLDAPQPGEQAEYGEQGEHGARGTWCCVQRGAEGVARGLHSMRLRSVSALGSEAARLPCRPRALEAEGWWLVDAFQALRTGPPPFSERKLHP